MEASVALEHVRRAEERRALALRSSGKTYSEIAFELDYASPEMARAAVESALAGQSEDDPETARLLELYRLDRMLEDVELATRGILSAALSALGEQDAEPARDPYGEPIVAEPPDPNKLLNAVTKSVKLRLLVMDRRAALLGLNQSPTPPDTGQGQTVIERVVIAVGGQQPSPQIQPSYPHQGAYAELIEATPPLRIPPPGDPFAAESRPPRESTQPIGIPPQGRLSRGEEAGGRE